MIYETAGILNINPERFSLRELVWMVEGFRMENWNYTAALLAMQANINRKQGQRAYQVADFHPFMKRLRRPAVIQAPITVLKDIFIDGKDKIRS